MAYLAEVDEVSCEKTEEKHPGGRPPILKTPEQTQELIDKYFEKCKRRLLTDKNGEVVVSKVGEVVYYQEEYPTITGLALSLGFKSRQSIYDYLNNEEKKEYSYILTRAVLKVENSYEQKLYEKNNRADFALGNMGWNNKRQVEHSGYSPINFTIEAVEPPENTDK